MEALARVRQPLVTCEPVVTEALYHVRQIQGAPQAILTNIQEGRLEISFRVAGSAALVSELMKKYTDTPCDFADACLIRMADELNTGDILTLDSDFKHYRWRRNRRFNLLIPLD
jgi:predicted nucleic acid-binding protein